MTPILMTEKLTHIYSVGTPFEHVAIRDVDFQAHRGERIGIIGHTGSGKSTLIQHLNGLIKPTSGRVLFDGEDIYSSKERTRDIRFKVGLVFQYPEYQLFEETVYKDIAFGPKNIGLGEKEIDARVREAASFVGLGDDELMKSPFELSGGQKRRAAIAGVIAMRPEVLILDEPTAGLDPRGRDEIVGNINAYRAALGSTVIMVSHSMEEIAGNVDRIVVMNNARIEMQGEPREVFLRANELSEIGLSAPKAALIAAKLRSLGLPVPRGVYTGEELISVLVGLKGRGQDA